MAFINNVFLFSLLFISPRVFAEYRVYQYILPATNEKEAKILTSTYDPRTLMAYHRPSGDFSLIRTWICPGYTGKFKKLCPSPYAKAQSNWEEEEQTELSLNNQEGP